MLMWIKYNKTHRYDTDTTLRLSRRLQTVKYFVFCCDRGGQIMDHVSENLATFQKGLNRKTDIVTRQTFLYRKQLCLWFNALFFYTGVPNRLIAKSAELQSSQLCFFVISYGKCAFIQSNCTSVNCFGFLRRSAEKVSKWKAESDNTTGIQLTNLPCHRQTHWLAAAQYVKDTL